MSIKIYVAGSSREIPRVRRVQNALRALGVEITYDWTKDVEAAIAHGRWKSEMDMPDDVAHAQAQLDAMSGVFAAHTVFAVAPDIAVQTRGLWWEMGFACGAGAAIEAIRLQAPLAGKLVRSIPRVVVTGPYARQTLFTRFGSTRILPTDRAGVEWVAETLVGRDDTRALLDQHDWST